MCILCVQDVSQRYHNSSFNLHVKSSNFHDTPRFYILYIYKQSVPQQLTKCNLTLDDI